MNAVRTHLIAPRRPPTATNAFSLSPFISSRSPTLPVLPFLLLPSSVGRFAPHARAMRNEEARPRKRRRPPLRRKTVRWSACEVDALLAGVRLHGVGKWAAILRNSPVFNGVRTSVDLKDKWRNLTSPVRAAALASPSSSSAPHSSHPLVAQARAAVDDICADAAKRSTEIDVPAPSLPVPSDQPPDESCHIRLETHTAQQPDSPNPTDHHPSEEQHVLNPDDASLHDDRRPESLSNQPLPTMSDASSPMHSSVASSLDHHPSPAEEDRCDQPEQHPQIPPKMEDKPDTQTFQCHIPYVPLQPLQAPSESSVSPEVLSLPPTSTRTQNPQPILSASAPHPPTGPSRSNLHDHQPVHIPNPAHPLAQNHVAAMQHAVSQSIYQSAAAIANYWRRVGHDPTPYGFAATLAGTSVAPHVNPYYAAGAAPVFPSVDDDDDDDDDDEYVPPLYPQYHNPYAAPFRQRVSSALPNSHSVRDPQFRQQLQPVGMPSSPANPVVHRHNNADADATKATSNPKSEPDLRITQRAKKEPREMLVSRKAPKAPRVASSTDLNQPEVNNRVKDVVATDTIDPLHPFDVREGSTARCTQEGDSEEAAVGSAAQGDLDYFSVDEFAMKS